MVEGWRGQQEKCKTKDRQNKAGSGIELALLLSEQTLVGRESNQNRVLITSRPRELSCWNSRSEYSQFSSLLRSVFLSLSYIPDLFGFLHNLNPRLTIIQSSSSLTPAYSSMQHFIPFQKPCVSDPSSSPGLGAKVQVAEPS